MKSWPGIFSDARAVKLDDAIAATYKSKMLQYSIFLDNILHIRQELEFADFFLISSSTSSD